MATSWTNETDSTMIWAGDGPNVVFWHDHEGNQMVTDDGYTLIFDDSNGVTSWVNETDSSASWTNESGSAVSWTNETDSTTTWTNEIES